MSDDDLPEFYIEAAQVVVGMHPFPSAAETGIAIEAVRRAILQARSQAFEEVAAYVEGKDGKIPATAVFAPLVSQNRMPDMSGDPRARLSPPRRREFDDATRDLSQAIRQHSQKGRDSP